MKILLIDFMEYSPFWKTNIPSGLRNPAIILVPEIQCCLHNSATLFSRKDQMNPVDILQTRI
jgi:hypothetical protein